MSMSATVPGWQQANTHKTAQASARNAELAQRALSVLGDDMPADWRDVAEAVIASPGQTWDQVAAQLGVTRYVAAGRFRRLLVRAGVR